MTIIGDHVKQNVGSKDENTALAYERTFLAYENTQLAWLRTSLSLISFGFGTAKFFDTLRQKAGKNATLLSPHDVGVLMIGCGLIILIAATLWHRRSLTILRQRYPELPKSISGLPSALFAILGLFALAGALIR